MQDFRKLAVWEKSHQFVLAVYDGTAGFPVEERYGLTSKLRRCAVSIPSNIAEGGGRGSQADIAPSCRSHWDRRVKRSINSCSVGISAVSLRRTINPLFARSRRSSEC